MLFVNVFDGGWASSYLLTYAGLDFPALPSAFLRPPKICVSNPIFGTSNPPSTTLK